MVRSTVSALFLADSILCLAFRPLPKRHGALVARALSSTAVHSQRRRMDELRDKVDLEIGPLGRLSKIVPPKRGREITTRVGSTYGGNHSLSWVSPPRTVLFVKKPQDPRTSVAMAQVVEHMRTEYPDVDIVVEESVYSEFVDRYPFLVPYRSSDKTLLAQKVDFVVTLGGDGSILHVSGMFDRSAVPPVLSFSMGTLGFLLPFHIDQFRTAIADLFASRASLLLRMRLCHSVHGPDGEELRGRGWDGGDLGEGLGGFHLMNEVCLHRGRRPHMTVIDAFVDGEHLTEAIADGLIISTPTGSTAYSLSAGGPIVHPSVQSLVLTPICPRSLSFRPLLFPSDATIELKIASKSRSPADLSIDGRELSTLPPDHSVRVCMSPYPIPCVNRPPPPAFREDVTEAVGRRAGGLLTSGSGGGGMASSKVGDDGTLGVDAQKEDARSRNSGDNWVRDINTLLKFNATFGGRGRLEPPEGEGR